MAEFHSAVDMEAETPQWQARFTSWTWYDPHRDRVVIWTAELATIAGQMAAWETNQQVNAAQMAAQAERIVALDVQVRMYRTLFRCLRDENQRHFQAMTRMINEPDEMDSDALAAAPRTGGG